jgi:uncharacterized protein
MKVIIDTNVLVSAVIKDRKPEKLIMYIAGSSDFEWIVSYEILEEYKKVLARDKLGLSDLLLNRWLNLIEEFTYVFVTNVYIDFPRDQKDAKFLECALSVNADFLITGDKDFEQAQKISNTTIISVSLFDKIFCEYKELSPYR